MARMRARLQLEHLSVQHERCDDGGSLKIDRHASVTHTKLFWEDSWYNSCRNAVEVGRPHPCRDKREHVWPAENDRAPAPLEKGPSSPDNYRSGQHELNPCK